MAKISKIQLLCKQTLDMKKQVDLPQLYLGKLRSANQISKPYQGLESLLVLHFPAIMCGIFKDDS